MLDVHQVNREYNVSLWKSKVTCTSNLVPVHDRTAIVKHF